MLSFLQQENTNLIQENNSVRTVSYRYLDRYSHPRKLHLELIQQEESLSERENACHLNVQSARDEVKHLLFTNNQLIAQLRDKVRRKWPKIQTEAFCRIKLSKICATKWKFCSKQKPCKRQRSLRSLRYHFPSFLAILTLFIEADRNHR